MAPVRKLLPPVGGIDLSPILVFIIINVCDILLNHAAVATELPSKLTLFI